MSSQIIGIRVGLLLLLVWLCACGGGDQQREYEVRQALDRLAGNWKGVLGPCRPNRWLAFQMRTGVGRGNDSWVRIAAGDGVIESTIDSVKWSNGFWKISGHWFRVYSPDPTLDSIYDAWDQKVILVGRLIRDSSAGFEIFAGEMRFLRSGPTVPFLFHRWIEEDLTRTSATPQSAVRRLPESDALRTYALLTLGGQWEGSRVGTFRCGTDSVLRMNLEPHTGVYGGGLIEVELPDSVCDSVMVADIESVRIANGGIVVSAQVDTNRLCDGGTIELRGSLVYDSRSRIRVLAGNISFQRHAGRPAYRDRFVVRQFVKGPPLFY